MYRQSAAVPQICPTEEQCEKWAGTGGKSHADRERRACHTCDLFPTKLDRGKGHKARLGLVRKALILRRERLSGYPRPPERMTTLQFQTMLTLDHFMEEEDIQLRVLSKESLMAMAGLQIV
jgi:hypothetical protein